MPSRTRATTSITMPWDTPQSSEAPANQTVPITRIFLRTEAVPQGSPQQDQRRQGQQIAGEYPLKGRNARMEILRRYEAAPR